MSVIDNEKLLKELQAQAYFERPKNRSVAALWMFEDTKILMFLRKDHPFTQWLSEHNAMVSNSKMNSTYAMQQYYNDGWIMVNPLAFSPSGHQKYLYFANMFVARRFQNNFNKYGIDSLIAEEKMSNRVYSHLIGYYGEFYI